MAELEVWLTNRSGSLKRRAFQFTGLEVEHILNDSRTAKVSMPLHDYNALGQSNLENLRPGRRFLKVVLKLQTGSGVFRRPIHWGPIVKPIVDFEQRTVEVNSICPSLYLIRHFIRSWDVIVEITHPVNGLALWGLAVCAIPTEAEESSGFPGPGIVQGALATYDELREVRGRIGENVWAKMLELAQAADGPDFDLEPIDEDYDPDGTWEPGVFCRLNTFQRKGADNSSGEDAVIFHYGWGRDNLENFRWEPDFAVVRNRFIATSDRRRQEARAGDQIQALGMMEDWYTTSSRLDADGLREFAKGQVQAYGEVPDFFTMVPRIEQGPRDSQYGTPARYPLDFSTGTKVRAVARVEDFTVGVNGRIISVKTTQASDVDSVRQEVIAVPEVIGDEDVATEPV